MAKVSVQLRIGRDLGAADDAHRLADAGDEEQQRDARIAHQVAQAVDAIVAAAVGDEQRVLVDHAHEARRIAARRAVEAFRPAGRQHQNGAASISLRYCGGDVVGFLEHRRTVRRVGIETLELLRSSRSCGLARCTSICRVSDFERSKLTQAASNCLPSCAVIARSRICPGSTGAASRTGVNCSVRPMSRDSVSTRRVAPTSPSRCRRSAAAPRSRSAPRALLRRRRARPAACAPPACPAAARTETRADASARIRRRDRASARTCSSVSVGKPAMMSAPNTTSGRSRRTVSQNAIASAREMAPLHALEDEVVAGLQRQMQMRHQPRRRCASASSRSRSASTESIDDSRSRSQLRHVLEDLLHQRAELRRAGQVGAIARDVDAGQHDLAIAVVDEPRAPRRPPRPSAPSANCRGHTE